MAQWTINTAIVLNQATGQVAINLAGQRIQVVVRGTTTAYPIIETGSLDPIPSSLLTVSPIGTLPPFIIETDTPEDLYLDWRDPGSTLQGGIGFEEVMREVALAARNAASVASSDAEVSRAAAQAAQAGLAGAVDAVTATALATVSGAVGGIPAQVGAAVTAQVTPIAAAAQASATAAAAAQVAAEGASSAAAASAVGVVRTVNGAYPDASGNVTVATGTGGSGSGGAVTSVAGKTGAVALVKGDVGLGQVDNTSDAAKPVSTAQAAALAGKASVVHTHTVSDVTGLQAALDSKAGVNNPVNASQVNAGTGVISPARLGSGTPGAGVFLRGDGTWATPPAGGGTGGGGAVDSVNGKTGTVSLDAGDVGALPTSTVYVASVAGRTGTVILGAADVGLGSVNNTSDAAKPVSTAQAAALAGKADDTAVLHKSGAETVAGVKTFAAAPVVPDGAFPVAKTAGLQAALDAKVGGTGITAITSITQAAYDALSSKSPTTLYVIVAS
ncbi:phage upper tail fiber protein [Xylanimonas protaetiae]|uniref:Minor tail protein gp31 C-terminal domain-containing protein n=1 Tax=Xylanimonas protaetiae TaxID=2509457 RepID=A0A4P6F5D8_9MICO|nr:hypothetical protein [Xylanimonas protaetiae]QAY69973.1 hypothetical protein ET471_07960 [Xylanimonas protaetiae]